MLLQAALVVLLMQQKASLLTVQNRMDANVTIGELRNLLAKIFYKYSKNIPFQKTHVFSCVVKSMSGGTGKYRLITGMYASS